MINTIQLDGCFISENVYVTNPHTIKTIEEQSHNKLFEPKNSVEPHSLIFSHLHYCDYTGFLDKQIQIYSIGCPSLTLRNIGINFCEEKKQNACTDLYNYCKQKYIFPINKTILEHFNVTSILVTRSSGVVEDDWILNPYQCTYIINDELHIPVCKMKNNIEKMIPISDFFKLNTFFDNSKQQQFIEFLDNLLKKYYNIEIV